MFPRFRHVDGGRKSANDLTDTSQNCCLLCGATPQEMNNLRLLKTKSITIENTKYGLHTLHLWIRSLEYVLQIAYKLETKRESYSRLSEAERKLRNKESRSSSKNCGKNCISLWIIQQPEIFFKAARLLRRLLDWTLHFFLA
eukprot:Pompholyxophrys_sp_v1_NODE_245_length_990_cov_1.197861.p1 type:complete len:142 gc:universal NODE_245_length_990_cov_1.197861:39-464(+)